MILNAMAIVSLEDKQSQVTIDYGKRAVAIEPGNPGCHYTLGLGYNGIRQYENALHHLQEAIRLQPGFGAAYTGLCSILNDIGKPDEAIRAGETALAINPDDAFAHTNLANAYLAKGNSDAPAHTMKEQPN